MTKIEKQLIINEIIDKILLRSKTIEDLVLETSVTDNDLIELDKGRSIPLSVLKDYIKDIFLEDRDNLNLGITRLLVPCDADGNELSWQVGGQLDENGEFKAKSLRAKVGLWTDEYISVGKRNPNGTGGGTGGSFGRLDEWTNYDPQGTDALSAVLGYGLKMDIESIDTRLQKWVEDQKYLTEHQKIYGLSFTSGKFSSSSYDPTSKETTVQIPTTTDHISEGNNKYFTDDRAQAAIKPQLDLVSRNLSILGNNLSTFKNLFDSMFVKETDENGISCIKALYGLYTDEYISVGKRNPNGTGGGTGDSSWRLDDWVNYDPEGAAALSAKLGYGLKTDIESINTRIDNLPTTSVNPHALTIKRNGEILGTYTGAIPVGVDIDTTWNGITGKPVTLAGYGITDAYTKDEADTRYLQTSAYTASDVLAKIKTVDGAGSGLDADLLDGHHRNDFNGVARFGTTAMYSNGYYKIKIKNAGGWMLAFKILAYQSYRLTEITVCGYNRGSYHWHAPAASLSSQGAVGDSVQVTFGYDSDWHLWVAIPAGSYAGISVTDVANGYQQIPDVHDLFEIVYEETLTGTVQQTLTATRHATLLDTVANAGALGGKDASLYVTTDTTQTITATKTLGSAAQIVKSTAGSVWANGRNDALIRSVSAGANSYIPLWSAKSENGSWDCGTYMSNILHFSYITDANYNAGNNSVTADIYFTTDGGINATSFVRRDGTAKQFLKANGSVDENNYIKCYEGNVKLEWQWGSDLTHIVGFESKNSYAMRVYDGDAVRNFANAVSKAGDTMTGRLTINMPSSALALFLNSGSAAEIGVRLLIGNVNKGWVGYHPTYGTNLYNYNCAKYLGINDSGVPNLSGSTIWHAGNDGSGSGLDADLLDGAHADDIRKSVLRFRETSGTAVNGGCDLNTLAPDGGLVTNYGSMYYWGNAPLGAQYGMALHLVTNYNIGGQFFADINHNSATDVTRTLWWRASGTVNGEKAWGQWHQIAFTDGNIASADRLSDTGTYTAWGNTFFVNGKPKSIGGSSLSLYKDTGAGGWARSVYAEDSNGTVLGSFGLRGGSQTLYYAYIGKYYDAPWLAVTPSGHVGIGTVEPTCPLDVNGASRINGLLTASVGISTTDITMSGVLNMGPSRIQSGDDYISLLKGSVAQRLLTGGLLASHNYADRFNIPANGIFSRGDIETAGSMIVNTALTTGGSVSVGDTLTVSGMTTLVGMAEALEDFHVTGLFAADGGIAVTGESNFASNVNIYADVLIDSSLYVMAGIHSEGGIHSETGLSTDGYISARATGDDSDMRLKDVTGTLDLDIRDIANAPCMNFRWKKDGLPDIGSSAQYFQNINPLFTPLSPKGNLTLQYGKLALLYLIPTARMVSDHESRISSLEEDNRKLKEENRKLKEEIIEYKLNIN